MIISHVFYTFGGETENMGTEIHSLGNCAGRPVDGVLN